MSADADPLAIPLGARVGDPLRNREGIVCRRRVLVRYDPVPHLGLEAGADWRDETVLEPRATPAPQVWLCARPAGDGVALLGAYIDEADARLRCERPTDAVFPLRLGRRQAPAGIPDEAERPLAHTLRPESGR